MGPRKALKHKVCFIVSGRLNFYLTKIFKYSTDKVKDKFEDTLLKVRKKHVKNKNYKETGVSL